VGFAAIDSGDSTDVAAVDPANPAAPIATTDSTMMAEKTTACTFSRLSPVMLAPPYDAGSLRPSNYLEKE
jgi:hypothetical protein